MDAQSSIRAVVFDFDGVIADSEPVHERALLEAVQAEGLTFSHDQYQAEIIGYDDRDAFPAIYRLNDRHFDVSQSDRLIASKLEIVHRLIRDGQVQPYPASLKLAQLAQAETGLEIAICSGALHEEIDLMLTAFGSSELFEIVVAADDVAKAKPDPAGYVMASKLLGVAPEQCACIEDTPHGIAAARAAGYGRIVGVEHSMPATELTEAHAVFRASTEIRIEDLLG